MSTGINNGKHHTINIYKIKLILFVSILINISGPLSAIKNEKGWIIVIDAGHGGKDPGAVGAFSYEKNIALAVALKTGEYIEQNIKNVTVIYTRRNDSFVELRDRANIANKVKADLFISIHVNATTSKNVKGTETYIMGIAKDQQNLEVAMKENEVILLEKDHTAAYEGFDPKLPESYIMFSLMQNIFQEQSTSLASKIQTQYTDRIKRTDRGVQQAGFWVLFMTTMPSVLTETGFISNSDEEKYLNSKQGQEYIASSIFSACSEYIDEINSKSWVSWSNDQITDPKTNISTKELSSDGSVLFMVQIGNSTSKNEVSAENFKGLTDIIEINAEDRYKYATGRFADYSAAVKYRKKIEKLYPDAFVIAVKDNKILPLQQVLEKKK
ncbi:MAG TPA: N-acetylmuramoyl-L-alanine amidase [Bacteroidales bacterium]